MRFDIIHGRVEKLRVLMREREMDAFVLLVLEHQNTESCHYISGFRGSSAALIIDGVGERLVTDGRYQTQAALQSPFALTIQTGRPLVEFIAKVVSENGYKSVGFEGEKLSYNIVEGVLKKVSTNWEDASIFIPVLRRAKDVFEVEAIKKASLIARQAYDKMLTQARVGMTEVEFGSHLLHEIKIAGAETGWAHDSFIVASGERGAMCHGRATQRAFGVGDTVTLDYGAMVDGYMCDITRNFAVEKAQKQAIKIDQILVKAHRDAASVLRPGVSGKEVDAVARKVIDDAGYGKNFIHGLGHGLGLEVHETPRLSPFSKDVLKPGDVVTIEPGIYIEGWGGLRVEDDYLITETGAECLTQSDDQHLKIAANSKK
ncbi:MAG: aminopeptidase P family protein [Synergistaceae bacterium]|jgi:Xaa-Pro aminopeptidase|nr:aminopeptidase P family protein [Synergistaceae bacterium]